MVCWSTDLWIFNLINSQFFCLKHTGLKSAAAKKKLTNLDNILFKKKQMLVRYYPNPQLFKITFYFICFKFGPFVRHKTGYVEKLLFWSPTSRLRSMLIHFVLKYILYSTCFKFERSRELVVLITYVLNTPASAGRLDAETSSIKVSFISLVSSSSEVRTVR